MNHNKKKERRLKRLKIPFKIIGNLVVVESDSCRILTGKEKVELPPDRVRHYHVSDNLLRNWLRNMGQKRA